MQITSPTQNLPRRGGINPMVRQLGLKELLQRDAEKVPDPQHLDEPQSLSALASHIRHSWGNAKLAKQKISLKLLDCLRARRGLYSPGAISQMQSQGGGSNIVWADITETKCRAGSAWIREIVLPVGEQPWSIDPQPLPDLPHPIKQGVVRKALAQAQQAMQQAAQAGGGAMSPEEFKDLAIQLGEQLRDDAEKQYYKKAEARSKRMTAQISDRLVKGGYEQAMDAFVEDFVTYPAAILKGPVYQRHKTLSWVDGTFEPQVSNNPAQSWERVSPFDVYPAIGARTCQEGDFIERMRFRRDELYALKGLPGYKDDQIDLALREYSEGHLEGWLWTEAERNRLENETLYLWLSPPGVIDALNYWGSVPGWKLMSWGVTGKGGKALEETRDYECNVLLCGHFILYATINPDPLDDRPYRKACYDDIPGAFWGRSIPDLASVHQKMCNAVACALADNLSIASGPQVWVHADRFADGEQSLEMFPWKIWQLKSDPAAGMNPGIGFFQPDDRSGPLMKVYEEWEIRADDATGIPRYTYGNQNAGGSADTATGLSMLMNNAAKGLRRAIASIDTHVVQPTIMQCFTNEMLYNPDSSIKGDCVVVARGAAALLIKESAQQRRIQFMQMVANPIDMAIIGNRGRAELLRETAAAMELPVDEIVPSDEELQQQAAQQAQQQQEQQQQAVQMQAQQSQQEHQQQLELTQTQFQQEMAMKQQSEQMIAQRESQARDHGLIGEVVKQAVATALAMHQESKKPRQIKYQHDEAGNIVGAQEVVTG